MPQPPLTSAILGHNLRAAREGASLTAYELASGLGITEETLVGLEAGEGNLSSLQLTRVAVLTSVPLRTLLDSHPAPLFDLPENASPATRAAVAWMAELVEDYEFLLDLTSDAATAPRA